MCALLVLLLAGCAEEGEDVRRGPLSPEAKKGRKVFLQEAEPPCGKCHTLGHAGAQSRRGPNLDVLRPTREQIRTAIEQGRPGMPAQADTLSPGQIEALTSYVVEARGRGR